MRGREEGRWIDKERYICHEECQQCIFNPFSSTLPFALPDNYYCSYQYHTVVMIPFFLNMILITIVMNDDYHRSYIDF